LAQIRIGAAFAGIENIFGQGIAIARDPCRSLTDPREFNLESLVGSIVGGAVGTRRANQLGGSGDSALGRATAAVRAGIPSLGAGVIGTGVGGGF